MDPDMYNYVGKLPKQHFNVWLFSNPGEKILILVEIFEAKVSEWNVRKLLKKKCNCSKEMIKTKLKKMHKFSKDFTRVSIRLLSSGHLVIILTGSVHCRVILDTLSR